MTAPTTGWALVCKVCGLAFRDDQPIGEVADHWNEHEGVERDAPHLELTWLGPGPQPLQLPKRWRQ